MTDKEKAIVMAYTGKCMLTGDKFHIFQKYIEDIMGRPLMTHENGFLADAIKEKSKADFIALCADESGSENEKDILNKIIAEIDDEAEYAYADFDKYKEDILHAEPDELPDDDFRYGLRRAIEIINKYKRKSEDKENE